MWLERRCLRWGKCLSVFGGGAWVRTCTEGTGESFFFSSRFVFVARINGKELPYVFAGNTHTLLWTRDLIELSQLECILNYSGLDQFCNWYSNLEAAGNLILMINLTRIRTIALWFWRNVLFHYHCHSLVWIHGKAQYNDTLDVLIAEGRFSFSRSG